MTGSLLPELGRAIRRNWTCLVLLILMAPLLGLAYMFGTAPGETLALPVSLTAVTIVGMILLAVLHAHQRHTADRWSRQ